MEESITTLIMRHRITIQDGAFVLGVILLAGFGAYELSFTGSIEADKRVEFEEMLLLGALIIVSILYLGWRRVRDQEREISRRIAAERRAHKLAHTDPLTGLANRRHFETTLRNAAELPLGPNEVHAVLMLDLNGFKQVNDLFGHAEGDDLIAAAAAQLRSATRQQDLVARLGGDEFAIIAYHLAGVEGATNIALRILKAFEKPIGLKAHQHKVGLGIGIALFPRDADNAEELLRKADIALYRAKNESESAVRFFEEEMDRHVRERDSLERELRAAIGTSALRPWYQPIVDLKTGEVIAFEALARWSHSRLGDIEPERFIPIAESSGLIRPLGDWLLRCAVNDAMSWPHHVTLSFNISPAQLKDPTLGLRILKILGEAGLPPQRLEVEITESALVRDMEMAKSVLSSLRDAGISIAIDDFGTGYSNLYHLRHFKLDKLKIDRSFIHAMNSEVESAAIVRALTGLGKGLGLTIIAEGIEDGTERDTLVGQGCQQGQGFLFSQAVPAAEIGSFFADRTTQTKVASGADGAGFA
jgi:diguanylate cyclase (GGDEF)-like protein